MPEQALADLSVLDISQQAAGPFCTKLLAGLGAKVIKIESPRGGDPARFEGPFFQDQPGIENSGLFLFLNTNKRSLSLDITKPEGKRIFRQLAETADVVVESLTPGTMEDLGLSYSALASLNPGLVLTSITPFGQTGPYAGFAATHLTLDAMAGLTYLRGDLNRQPLYPGGFIGDCAGGLAGFVGTLTALLERDRSGLGQQVDISILEVLLHYAENYLILYPWQGIVPNREFWPSSATGFLSCRDGYERVSTVVGRNSDLSLLVERPELLDEKFGTAIGRTKHLEELEAVLQSWLAEHDKREIFESAQERRLPFGYVATAEDLVSDPQNIARKFFIEADHPIVGKAKYPGPPFRMSETPWQSTTAAPLLGQHTAEILSEFLGYTCQDLARLREDDVI